MPFVTCAGHALEYEWRDAGAPGKPTLVFLHEGLGSIRQWRDFPQQVAQATGCHALVYSRYGYGQSDVLAEPRVDVRFMHREALEALPELLAKLAIERPVLIGHSDGASIALIHAGAGHAVRGLALMAPHVFVEPICVTSIGKASAAFASTDLAQRLAKYHRDPRKTFHLWADVWLDPEFLQWNIEEYLPGIACPVLAIQGEDDEYGTMAQVEAIRRGVRGPCELRKLAACGHAPFRDQPQATLEAMTRFIDERCR
ncbi:MAG: alpha/beta hydrolase [Betaproteobacteria bacterium]|nr:alpha/beta hydrolase [Betaproteobacteria bacterium]